ncbi:MAG TPA: zinc ABC transporter substrate-binding protein [Gammaproteobacteria bacterium]|nr:zinc ABC transporter substrate-binding protein [Gammaproteobacteria bacterium]
MHYAKQLPCLRITLLLLTLVFAPTAIAADKLKVYTVNYPLAYFTERIAGEQAEVVFPAPPDVDPAFWMPDTDTIIAYQRADLIVINGANYAKWISKVSLPRLRMVDTSRPFADRFLQQQATSHSHGTGGDHSHSGTAFTTWLDPGQAVQQAEVIAAALTRKRPAAKQRFESNLDGLKSDLLALDERIARITMSAADSPILASHPVYQYLARRYGLNLRSVMWEPDEVPDESQWAEFVKILEEFPAKWMLWEAEPASESVEWLRSLGVESIVFNPCGNRPESGDFLSVMLKNAASLEDVSR